jgi:hypothetical protein
VANQTLVFQIKFCSKSPALRVAAKRLFSCTIKTMHPLKTEHKLTTINAEIRS